MKKECWIVGAGPVGLLLAHLLHQKNYRVQLFEKRSELPALSMAIGITPPSLAILDRIGLRDSFEQEGIAIRQARVFENRQPVGRLGFEIAGDHILSLPQCRTLHLLRESLLALPDVTLHENFTFTKDTPLQKNIPVIGCDGAHSVIRQRAGIPLRTKSYSRQFFMADFQDIEDAGPDARLFFSPRGSVESFPLPHGLRRWVVQVLPGQSADISHLISRVRDAADVDLHGVTHETPSSFVPRRGLADRFYNDRFILCGDAAHQLSPIGGQGMNTGFADAFQLADALCSPHPRALSIWSKQRRKVFNQAATRAAWGMNLGTLTGRPASTFRKHLLRGLLHQPQIAHTLSRTYAMLNLAYPVKP